MMEHSSHKSIGLLMVFLILLLCLLIAQQLGLSFPKLELAAQGDFTAEDSIPAELPNPVTSPTPDTSGEESILQETVPTPPIIVNTDFIRIKDSCDAFFTGECVRVRSGPGLEYPVVSRVRNDMILRVAGTVFADGIRWYNVVFDEWLRYPERVEDPWYIASDFAEPVITFKEESAGTPQSSDKKIIVDRSEQKLYAYAGETLFMESNVSTGLELTPTPRGTFSIFKKLPSRYMQGPLPYLENSKYYDLPGVPWNLYFTEQGAIIHGAYWHTSFGSPYSHGCVNLLPAEAKKLYEWASLGTTVVVQE